MNVNYYNPYVREELMLYHHGVLGMEHGVRNGPPYPLSRSRASAAEKKAGWKESKWALKEQKKADKVAIKGNRDSKYLDEHTIKKGTIMYRTSINPNETMEGSKYVTYLSPERNLYKGGWVRQTGKSEESFEYEYKLKEDLKVPSREELYVTVDEVIEKNKKIVKETVNNWMNIYYPENSWRRAELLFNSEIEGSNNEKWKKLVNKELDKFKGMTVNQAVYYSLQTFGKNNKLKDKVISELSKKGYNGMVDEASVGGQNNFGREGIDPIIIFNGNVLEKSSVKSISRDEEKAAYSRYSKFLKRADKSKRDNWGKFSMSRDSIIRLAKLYKSRGYTQEEAAKRLGLDPSIVSMMLNGTI